jgi:hypothetical protein
LRVDEESHQTPRSPSCGSPTGEPATLRPADGKSSSTVVYCGDAVRVRKGFAIALGLLGLGGGMVDDVTRAQSEDGE